MSFPTNIPKQSKPESENEIRFKGMKTCNKRSCKPTGNNKNDSKTNPRGVPRGQSASRWSVCIGLVGIIRRGTDWGWAAGRTTASDGRSAADGVYQHGFLPDGGVCPTRRTRPCGTSSRTNSTVAPPTLVQGVLLQWAEWNSIDTLLGEILTTAWSQGGDFNVGAGKTPAQRYDWGRYVLGRCIEYQESDVDIEDHPRFRLKDWHVELEELRQGQRALVPHYSHSDLIKFIKILWNMLRPVTKGGEFELSIVAVDHEGCSSSMLINGYAVDILWTLTPDLHTEVQTMWDSCGHPGMFAKRCSFVDDLMRLFFLNRSDIVVVEDGACVGGRDSFWRAALDVDSEVGLLPKLNFQVPDEGGQDWMQDGTFHSQVLEVGDVIGILHNYGRQSSDFICTLSYPDKDPTAGEGMHRDEFKKVNKCALAKSFWQETRGDAHDECTALRNVAVRTLTRAAIRMYAHPPITVPIRLPSVRAHVRMLDHCMRIQFA